MLALIVGRENGEEMVEIKTGCVCVSVSVCVREPISPTYYEADFAVVDLVVVVVASFGI